MSTHNILYPGSIEKNISFFFRLKKIALSGAMKIEEEECQCRNRRNANPCLAE